MSQEPTPPYTRRRSEEVPADRLTDFRLKQLEEAVQTCSETSNKVLQALNEMNARLAVGAERFVSVDKRIESLEGDRRWTVMALLSALGSLAWQALTSLLHIGPKLALLAVLVGCASRTAGVHLGEDPPAATFDDLIPWLIAMSVIGIAASIAALVWIPIQRWIPLAGLTFFASCIVVALSIPTLTKIMPWVIGGGIAVGLVWVFFHFRNRIRAGER